MRFLVVASFAAVASAQFQLYYPEPRGPFVENMESMFCGGYANAASTRTIFPIKNGLINVEAETPIWNAQVVVSTSQNPTSPSDFSTCSGFKTAVPRFRASGRGRFCFPIDLASSGIPGVRDGANVTVQLVFDGGDGPRYQCADLTLSADAALPCGAHHGCTDVSAGGEDDGREQLVMPRGTTGQAAGW